MGNPNKRRLRLLVKELRSGKWKQCRTALRQGEKGRCCLGVACEVYMRATKKGVRLEGRGTHLPASVARWYGIERDPLLGTLRGSDGHNESAIAWNDDYKKRFSTIATAFERTYGL